MAQATQRGNALSPQPPSSSPPAVASKIGASVALPLEDRVASLESALARVHARIAELETGMRTQTYRVNQVSVGLLVEKLIGRDVPLAIGPRWQEGATGPARP